MGERQGVGWVMKTNVLYMRESPKKMAFPVCDLEVGEISPGGQAVLGSLCQNLSPLPEVAGLRCPYAGPVSRPWSQGSGGEGRKAHPDATSTHSQHPSHNFLILLIDPGSTTSQLGTSGSAFISLCSDSSSTKWGKTTACLVEGSED